MFSIYIPLCFYFILDCCSKSLTLIHLHSTMLLLYQFVGSNNNSVAFIYIPLCFYFIFVKVIFKSSSTDLHSTMLLLYRSWHGYVIYRSIIYIPLCFYFIWSDARIPVLPPNLHSTMLLLYRNRYQNFLLGFLFTFHYASTLSTPTFNNALGINGFTFHYASTLSPCPWRESALYVIYIPLCFYFIRNAGNAWFGGSIIYIPLCFYFI